MTIIESQMSQNVIIVKISKNLRFLNRVMQVFAANQRTARMRKTTRVTASVG